MIKKNDCEIHDPALAALGLCIDTGGPYVECAGFCGEADAPWKTHLRNREVIDRELIKRGLAEGDFFARLKEGVSIEDVAVLVDELLMQERVEVLDVEEIVSDEGSGGAVPDVVDAGG